MPLFEVFIPTSDPDGFNITARLRADSWIAALKGGLARLGDTTDVRNVMCDFTETGIDVTEPKSGRVFRIRELPEGAATAAPPSAAPVQAAPQATPAPAIVAVPTPAPAVVTAAPPAVVTTPPPAAPTVRAAPPPAAVTSAPPPAAPVKAAPPPAAPRAAPPPAAPPATARTTGRFAIGGGESVESEVREKAGADAAVITGSIGRPKIESERPVEEILEELFGLTGEIYQQPDLGAAAGYLLDLALKAIPSESGAVFVADISRNDLFFAAARGPKAKEVMGFRVPMGIGIVGFSATEAVSLAVSDVHKHPAFYKKISESLGYQTRSILCSPAAYDGRVVGAIELINKPNGTSYSHDEVSVLNFLSHEFGDYLGSTGQTR